MKYLEAFLRQTDTEAPAPEGANDSLTKLTEASVNSQKDSLTEPTKLTIPPKDTPFVSNVSRVPTHFYRNSGSSLGDRAGSHRGHFRALRGRT
jgi:hypothetical protein